ncbi:MAG: hypothetical protein ACJ71B_04330 [Nitrososphaera sp.]
MQLNIIVQIQTEITSEPSHYLMKNYANYYGYGTYPPIGWIPTRYAAPTYPVPTAATRILKE